MPLTVSDRIDIPPTGTSITKEDGMNLLIFGPNGSGKGTQGALLMEKYGVAHIESGAVFRQHVGQGTEMGKKAKEYMDKSGVDPASIELAIICSDDTKLRVGQVIQSCLKENL